MSLIRSWNAGALRSALAALAVAAAPAVATAQQAIITGRVTAEGSGEPLVESRVAVVSSTVVATTNAEGRYTLRGVAPGEVVVRVLRVGYSEQKKSVVIAPGASVTVDFVLQPAIVKLQEIVTTATGQQRKVELGNTVAVIDAATRVKEMPIHTMNDLLVAKARGCLSFRRT